MSFNIIINFVIKIFKGKLMKFLMLIILAFMSNFGFANPIYNKSEWNSINDPSIMSNTFRIDYREIPRNASILSSGLGWPGHYWPNFRGGIANRWNSSYANDFEYESPSRYEALKMSSREINMLSPAEKYDLYVGDYSYPTVKYSWGYTNRLHADWKGICHGVAPASLNHAEPKQVTLTNPDGINITFYSADVKALLAFYYAKMDNSRTSQVGKRCFVKGWLPMLNKWNGCKDVNAGAFHIILGNKLGIMKKSVIADIDRYSPVWNHAALEYEFTELSTSSPSRKSAPGTYLRVLVNAKVKYAASIKPSHLPVIGTNKAKYELRTYRYWLELDFRNNIIGGEWVSDDRPDFLWYKDKAIFNGYYSKINDIYKSNH